MAEDKRSPNKTEGPMTFIVSHLDEEPGRKRKTYVRVEVEDIIAIVAGLIAFMFAVAMIFGAVPINGLTAGILGFSGCGGIVAHIVGARRGKETRSPWLKTAVWSLLAILILAIAFVFYLWLNR